MYANAIINSLQTLTNLLIPQFHEISAIIISILKIRKLRLWNAQYHGLSTHRSGCESRILAQAVWAQSWYSLSLQYLYDRHPLFVKLHIFLMMEIVLKIFLKLLWWNNSLKLKVIHKMRIHVNKREKMALYNCTTQSFPEISSPPQKKTQKQNKQKQHTLYKSKLPPNEKYFLTFNTFKDFLWTHSVMKESIAWKSHILILISAIWSMGNC